MRIACETVHVVAIAMIVGRECLHVEEVVWFGFDVWRTSTSHLALIYVCELFKVIVEGEFERRVVFLGSLFRLQLERGELGKLECGCKHPLV